LGVFVADGFKGLHVRDGNRIFHRGVDAFFTILQNLPRWDALDYVASLPCMRTQLIYCKPRLVDIDLSLFLTASTMAC